MRCEGEGRFYSKRLLIKRTSLPYILQLPFLATIAKLRGTIASPWTLNGQPMIDRPSAAG